MSKTNSIGRYLIPGERPQGAWRHHWLWLLGKTIVPLVIMILGIGLTSLGGKEINGFTITTIIIYAVGLIFLSYRFLNWLFRYAFVSNLRVGEVGGLIGKLAEDDVMFLNAVQDIDVERPGWKALLGWTNYNIQSGSGNVFLRGYPAGIDTAIWTAKGVSPPPPSQPPTSTPTSSSPPSEGTTPPIRVV